jgi:DNA-binding beta-propeller fold protein YncE
LLTGNDKEKIMKKQMVLAVLLTGICAGYAFGGYTFEGKWGSYGTGDGQFDDPAGAAVAANGNVYVADGFNQRIQYFTPTGSFLGKWDANCVDVGVAADGNVYVTTGPEKRVYYYTPTGSQLGSFTAPVVTDFGPIDFAPNRDIFVGDSGEGSVSWFSSTGSYKHGWGRGSCDPGGLACSPYGERVYVANSSWDNIIYFTYSGIPIESWGATGTGNGQFDYPVGTAIIGDGTVFVADAGNNRIQYFTPDGRFLGKWGSHGTGDGEFDFPWDVAPHVTGSRVYVVDSGNHRIQYFNRNEPAVVPASLGRVKALFR